MNTTGPHGRKAIGVVNLRVTRLLAFFIITFSVIACVVICILAVWEAVEPVFAWRAMASLGIIAAATAIFVSLNEGFGPAIHKPSGPPE